MGEAQILEYARDAILTMLAIAAPIMLTGLAVGVIVALFQALTQIQEMTLTFVPKILVVFLATLFLLPYMIATLQGFMVRVADRIIGLGTGS